MGNQADKAGQGEATSAFAIMYHSYCLRKRPSASFNRLMKKLQHAEAVN
jgi:hypothetical protein